MEDFEDSEFVASEHDRLVSAISKLDKTQHITEPTRNEPTNQSSEFHLIKRTNKLNLNTVAKVLEDTAHHVQISKKLLKTHKQSRVLSKPLEKPQAERIKRATGYEATKKKVGRWDPVVARSRTVDSVTFPLKSVSSRMEPTGDFLSKLQLKSDLEKELEEVDPPPMVVEEEEEEQIFPMTYEEMVEHRQHIAKLRAQQSYKAAKAKRQSKIKSKKYHRVLKKEKLKQELKEFEELQKRDPEEALKKLEALEKARALERHTLRHKNTGKWAKNKLIRAKYDKEVRQQLAEQLAVSRGLTQKVQDNDSTDDEAEDEAIPDISLSQDPMNPWMLQRSDKSNVNADFDFGYKKFIQNKMSKKDDSGSESNDENVEEPSKEFNDLKIGVSKLSQMEQDDDDSDDDNEEIIHEQEAVVTNDKEVINKVEKAPSTNNKSKLKNATKVTEDTEKQKKKTKKIRKVTATSAWEVESVNVTENSVTDDISSAFESHESIVAKKVEKKLKQIRDRIENLEKASLAHKQKQKSNKKAKKNKEVDGLEYLQFKNKNPKAIIDEELIETSSKIVDSQDNDMKDQSVSNLVNVAQTPASEPADMNIDPNRFIEVKPKYLNSIVPQGENEYDQLDDDEQVVPKVNIEEVFEEDDVVASFRQEKEDEINKDKPEEVNLTLPGWGAWGGKGVKPQKRRRNRFINKPPPKMPRRDENKGDIIIKEYKDPKLALHKVKDVPFPFESVKDYEASIRVPLGNTFIPEKAYRKLIKPSVITKAGTIIEPMDDEELLIPKHRSFKNEAVIKLLGQK